VVCSGMHGQNEQHDPKGIIERAVAALGGKAKLAGLERCYIKAKAKFPDMPVLWETWTEYPDRVKQVMSFDDDCGRQMKIIMVVNGKQGWKKLVDVQDGKFDTVSMPEEELKKDESYSHRVLVCRLYPLLEDNQVKMTFEGLNKDEKEPMYHVRVVTRKKTVLNLFFDINDNMLKRCSVRLSGGPHDGKLMETSFTDYKDFDGLKYATRVTSRIGGKVFTEEQVIDLRTIKTFPIETFSMP
jgi:hypothetical protein